MEMKIMSSELDMNQDELFERRLDEVIIQYKADFDRVNKDEKYKWTAVV